MSRSWYCKKNSVGLGKWDWVQFCENKHDKKAKEILAGIDAKLVSMGKIPQVTYIFRAKNFFGMKDQQDLVVTPAMPLGDAPDQKQLEERIAGSVVVEE